MAMTVPCTSCGAFLADDDLQCPRCGTLASPRWGASVFAEAPPGEPSSHGPVADETLVETGDPAPWSIPVREGPAAEVIEPRVGDADPFRALAVTVLGVALCAALVAGVTALFSSGGDAPRSGDDLASARSAEEEPQVLGDQVTAPTATSSTTSTAPPETSSTTTSSSTSTTTTSTTTTAPSPSSGDVPQLSSSFRSGWVAQLTSVPISAGTEALESAWERLRGEVPGAVATRSDEWPSMRDGYWVLVEAGPFGSEGEVDDFCASVGRSGDSCLPRMLADRR